MPFVFDVPPAENMMKALPSPISESVFAAAFAPSYESSSGAMRIVRPLTPPAALISAK